MTRLLDVAKGGFALRVEQSRIGLPICRSISASLSTKRQAQVPRQMAPDRGLATAGHADEGDDHAVSSAFVQSKPDCLPGWSVSTVGLASTP